MINTALEDKLRSLEDEIFYQVDRQLWEKLRQDKLRDEKRQQLGELMHVEDEAMLDGLIKQGIDNEKIAVLLMVPLVFVAWSDGRVTDAERKMILDITSHYTQGDADEMGKIIRQWLKRQPSEELWKAWQAYFVALPERASKPATAMLGEKLFEDATKVAHASDGFLSFGRLAPEKQQALDRLRAAIQIDQ